MFTARAADAGRSPLDALRPRRRRGAGAVGVAAVVGLLVAAWFSPALLRPRLVDIDQAEWDAQPGHVVQTVMRSGVDTWPWLTVTGVDDVPGARVASVTVENGRRQAPTGLLRTGDDAVVVVRWRITDCAALRADVQPVAHLRSAAGTPTTQLLPSMANPGFDRAALRAWGICPRADDHT